MSTLCRDNFFSATSRDLTHAQRARSHHETPAPHDDSVQPIQGADDEVLAACAAAVLFASPLFAESPPGSTDPGGTASTSTEPAGKGGDVAVEEQPQPSNPPPVSDSIVLANGKVRIGALF